MLTIGDLGTLKGMQAWINSGQVWKMEGSIGRAAMEAIECGQVMLGRTGCRDYWGNYIPSRYEVKQGTKGSSGYVRELFGQARVKYLQSVK